MSFYSYLCVFAAKKRRRTVAPPPLPRYAAAFSKKTVAGKLPASFSWSRVHLAHGWRTLFSWDRAGHAKRAARAFNRDARPPSARETRWFLHARPGVPDKIQSDCPGAYAGTHPAPRRHPAVQSARTGRTPGPRLEGWLQYWRVRPSGEGRIPFEAPAAWTERTRYRKFLPARQFLLLSSIRYTATAPAVRRSLDFRQRSVEHDLF